jgi:4-aminobutyrate aminotransferase-like enzyme
MTTLYERDEAVIAGIEKLRFFPLEVVSGHGSTLVTPDGRELLDLSATWTACGLGHGHPAVAEAVSRAIRNAPGAGALSAVHPDSVGLAEDLLALVPGTGERRVYLLNSDRIGDVRGRGLAIGLELVDPETGDRDARLAAQVVYRAWELGAVVYYVGGNVLEITPPLVLTDAEAERAADILGQAITDAAAGKVDDGEVARYAGW